MIIYFVVCYSIRFYFLSLPGMIELARTIPNQLVQLYLLYAGIKAPSFEKVRRKGGWYWVEERKNIDEGIGGSLDKVKRAVRKCKRR